jgi:hypothetical protein
VAYYQGFYRAHGAVHHPHIKKTANCRPCPIAHVRAERLAERAHLHTTMWSSCPDPTPSLIASAFAGGAVALACDYLRRVAVLRAALPRQSDRSCLWPCSCAPFGTLASGTTTTASRGRQSSPPGRPASSCAGRSALKYIY